MKLIEKWKYLLTAPKVPVVRFADNCRTIEFLGKVRVCSNHLMDDWNQRGWELTDAKPIRIVVNGQTEIGYAVHPSGVVVDLVDKVRPAMPELDLLGNPVLIDGKTVYKEVDANFEGVIGKLTCVGMLEDAVGLEPSMKSKMLFLALGLLLGWTVIAPVMSGVLS